MGETEGLRLPHHCVTPTLGPSKRPNGQRPTSTGDLLDQRPLKDESEYLSGIQ